MNLQYEKNEEAKDMYIPNAETLETFEKTDREKIYTKLNI